MFVQWRFTTLVGHFLADLGYLAAHFEQDPLDASPDHKVATRRTSRRQGRQCGQGDTGNVVDQGIDLVTRHQLSPLLHQPQSQQFGLDLETEGDW